MQKENHFAYVSCWIAIASNAVYGTTGFAMNTDWCNTVDRSLFHSSWYFLPLMLLLMLVLVHVPVCIQFLSVFALVSSAFLVIQQRQRKSKFSFQHPHILLHGFTCMLCVSSSCAHITHTHRRAGRISSVALFMFRQTCNVHIKLVMSSLYCIDLWLDTNGYQLSFYLFRFNSQHNAHEICHRKKSMYMVHHISRHFCAFNTRQLWNSFIFFSAAWRKETKP